MTERHYRYARPEDIAALGCIWQLSFGDEESVAQQLLEDRDVWERCTVCESGGEVCAMMCAFDGVELHGKMSSYLYGLCTHPRQRRQGIGRELLQECVDRALARGSEQVCLHPASTELARWYEGLGFVPAVSRGCTALFTTNAEDLMLRQLSGQEYARLRKKFGAAPLPDALLRAQELFFQIYGGGFYAGELAGCPIALGAENVRGKLQIKELLCPPSLRRELSADGGVFPEETPSEKPDFPPHLMFWHSAPTAPVYLPFLMD